MGALAPSLLPFPTLPPNLAQSVLRSLTVFSRRESHVDDYLKLFQVCSCQLNVGREDFHVRCHPHTRLDSSGAALSVLLRKTCITYKDSGEECAPDSTDSRDQLTQRTPTCAHAEPGSTAWRTCELSAHLGCCRLWDRLLEYCCCRCLHRGAPLSLTKVSRRASERGRETERECEKR